MRTILSVLFGTFVVALPILAVVWGFVNYPLITGAVVAFLVPFALFWFFWLSIKVVGKSEVAVPLFLGEPQTEVHLSGPVFVPWVPIKWDGHYPWELVRITTEMLPLEYEFRGNKERHKVWSKDHQLLFLQATLFVRFPYLDATELVKMIKAGVPLTDEGLTEWAEDVIIPALRKVMAKRTYEEAISDQHLAAINAEVNAILRDPDGVFMKSGIFGLDPGVTAPGSGEARLEVELVDVTEDLQKKLEKVATAKLDVRVARRVAQQQAIAVGRPIKLAMDEWVAGQVNSQALPPETLETAKARLVASGDYAKHERIVKDFILAEGGNLAVDRIEIGAPDGTPVQGDIGALAAVAALFGGRGRGQGGGGSSGKKGGKRKNPKDMSEEDRRNEANSD